MRKTLRQAAHLATFAAALAVVPAGASAATIEVDSSANAALNDGVCSLREAIEAANDNAASEGALPASARRGRPSRPRT